MLEHRQGAWHPKPRRERQAAHLCKLERIQAEPGGVADWWEFGMLRCLWLAPLCSPRSVRLKERLRDEGLCVEKEKGEQCPRLVRKEISKCVCVRGGRRITDVHYLTIIEVGAQDQDISRAMLPPPPERSGRKGFPASSSHFLVSLGVPGLWKHQPLFLFLQVVDESIIGWPLATINPVVDIGIANREERWDPGPGWCLGTGGVGNVSCWLNNNDTGF